MPVKRLTDPLVRGDVGFNVAPITVLEVETIGHGHVLLVLDWFRDFGQDIRVHKSILRRWRINSGRANVSLNDYRFMDQRSAKAWADTQVEAFGGYVLTNPGIDTWWPVKERLVTSRRKGGCGQSIRVSAKRPQRNRISAAHPYEPGKCPSVVSVECIHRQGDE